MSVGTQNFVFTIGHSNLKPGAFLELLQKHKVQAVADVRSSPYSRFNPQYNRETLQRALREAGISYVFLGAELGARREERECYHNGQADYSLIAHTPAFQRGISRVLQGASKMRVALMCAEKDPFDCHRCILLGPVLQDHGVKVAHILSNGTLERQEEVEGRLLRAASLAENDLFKSPGDALAQAYRAQGKKIAYREEDLALREENPSYGN